MIENLANIEAGTITDVPVKIPFEFRNKERLPEGKDPGNCIVIRPITVGTWFRIRPLLLKIEKDDFKRLCAKVGEVGEDLPELMDKYCELLLDIVCLGIHNKSTVPPSWFRQVLAENSTWEDIRILLNAVVYRIGFHPFCKSITTLQSVSPMDGAEMIAARKNLESWQNLVRLGS